FLGIEPVRGFRGLSPIRKRLRFVARGQEPSGHRRRCARSKSGERLADRIEALPQRFPAALELQDNDGHFLLFFRPENALFLYRAIMHLGTIAALWLAKSVP